jgi:hypothetical protein
VIAGNDEDRNAAVGDATEWLESLVSSGGNDVRTIEYVAAVHDEVDLVGERRSKRGGVVREEIMTPAPALDSWTRREVEAEVGVSEEEDADVSCHPAILEVSVFLR